MKFRDNQDSPRGQIVVTFGGYSQENMKDTSEELNMYFNCICVIVCDYIHLC